jgi:hypothetical protein
MILSTHAIVGAAIATFVPSHPAMAFFLGFASHFVLDAIPHWDYPIRSASVNPNIGAPISFDRALLRDVVTIGSDGLLGMPGSLFLFASPENLWAVAIGAFGAMLPDPLQFAHLRLPHEPLRTIQRFHRCVHTDRQIKFGVGIGSQLALVSFIVAVTVAVHGNIFGRAIPMGHGGG